MAERCAHALDSVIEAVNRFDYAISAKEGAIEAVRKDYERELAEIDREEEHARKAAMLQRTAQQAQDRRALNQLRREYEDKISGLSVARKRERATIEQSMELVRCYLAKVPEDLRVSQLPLPGSSGAMSTPHSKREYEGLLSQMGDDPLLVKMKGLFGGASPRRQSAALLHSMAASDLCYYESLLKKIDEGRDEETRLRAEYAGKKEALEAEQRTSALASGRAMPDFSRRKSALKDLFERRCAKISLSETSVRPDALVDECRRIANDAALRLQCSPRQLKERPGLPEAFPPEMFASWVDVTVKEKKLLVPHVYDVSKLRGIWIDYGNDMEGCQRALRTMVAMQLKCYPRGMVDVDWLDPVTMGRALGNLSDLVVSGGSARGCAGIRVTTSASGMSSRIDQIQEELTEVSIAVAREGGVWERNRVEGPVLSQKTIVVNGIENDGFSPGCIEGLLAIGANASNCGTQLLIACGDTNLCDDRKRELIARLRGMCEVYTWNGAEYEIDLPGKGKYTARFLYDGWITDDFVSALKEREDLVARAREAFVGTRNMSTVSGFDIPFGVDEFGNPVALRFGTEYAHAIVTGVTGSGKTVMLYSVIESACMRYTPDELELWLIDYKRTEFGLFRKDSMRFPHIGLIGVDDSPDFTQGLVDAIVHEFERRQQKILDSGMRDFSAYNRAAAPGSKLKRLLVIVDEFHVMSRWMAEGSGELRANFERILSEGRGAGIHLFISDQTITGLRGLTDTARKQISGRIMMTWSERVDVTEMFGVGQDVLGQAPARGEAYVKSADGFTWCKIRYVGVEDMERSCVEACEAYGKRRERWLCYDANERDVLTMGNLTGGEPGFVRLGTVPDFESPNFSVEVVPRRRENVFVLASQEKLALEVLLLVAAQIGSDRYAVVADPDCYLLAQAREVLVYLRRVAGGVEELTSVDALTAFFACGNLHDTTVILFGCEGLFEEMEDCPPRPSGQVEVKGSSGRGSDDGERDAFMALIGEAKRAVSSGEVADAAAIKDGPFDVRSEIFELIKRGGKNGNHVIWVSDTVPNLRAFFPGTAAYSDDIEMLFTHRIAGQCKRRDSLELGMRDTASSISGEDRDMKMAYVDKNGNATVFKPYAIEEV